MPKLKVTEKQKADDALRFAVKVARLKLDMTQKELAHIIGMCEPTLISRLKDPDKFTRGELRHLYKALHFSRDDIIDSLPM